MSARLPNGQRIKRKKKIIKYKVLSTLLLVDLRIIMQPTFLNDQKKYAA